MLVNMGNPGIVAQRRDAEATAPALGVTLFAVEVRCLTKSLPRSGPWHASAASSCLCFRT